MNVTEANMINRLLRALMNPEPDRQALVTARMAAAELAARARYRLMAGIGRNDVERAWTSGEMPPCVGHEDAP